MPFSKIFETVEYEQTSEPKKLNGKLRILDALTNFKHFNEKLIKLTFLLEGKTLHE